MTCRAVELAEVVGDYFGTESSLVAIDTGNRPMSPGERETGVLVFGQGVVRRLEGSPIVTLFAAVPPRSGRELALVFVFVTIQALRKLDLVSGLLACR